MIPAAAAPSDIPAASAAFRPETWLASLTAIGGRYALLADRKLWIGAADCSAPAIAMLMGDLLDREDRQEAVKRAIEQRQTGDTA